MGNKITALIERVAMYICVSSVPSFVGFWTSRACVPPWWEFWQALQPLNL